MDVMRQFQSLPNKVLKILPLSYSLISRLLLLAASSQSHVYLHMDYIEYHSTLRDMLLGLSHTEPQEII